MAKVELKQPIVQEISETIKDAQSLVVVDYRGLTVAEDTQLRKNLREAGVTYKVYKNTLVNRAIEGTEFESLKDVLEGPNAFAVSTEDATAPARVLAEFAKKAPSLEIKAGVVEGTYYDAEGMKQIASVPSREVLLSKLLGSLQSPITNLTRVLNQIAENGGAVATEAAPAEEKKPAKKAEEKKAEKKEKQDKLKEAQQTSDDDDTITISAGSIEELIKKINDYTFSMKSDNVQTEAELQLGQHIDFRG